MNLLSTGINSVLDEYDKARCGAGGELSEEQALSRLPLLLPVLEGLWKHAQLMGMEYHEDVLTLLISLIQQTSLPLRFRLVCLLVAATLYQ